MTDTARPAIRLMPKADARAIRWGAPWVYADNLVTDRRTRAMAPGTLAVLQDAERQEMALVAVNPASKIMARIIDRDPAAVVDHDWFARRLARALSLRARLYDAPFYRLIHAEADGLPGVVIDRFGDAAVIQPNAAWAEAHLDMLVAALVEVTGVSTVLKNAAGRARSLEGLDDESKVLIGTMPDAPVPVVMNGATYMADLAGGQKTGLFYDQRENQAFVQRLAAEARVLDVFSHVGGFGLAALAGGASHVTCVDASAPALDLAARGAEAMGQGAASFATRRGDAFETMTALEDEGLHFDLVVCDPPAFAPSKQALEAGLRAYEKVARAGARLVAPEGGYLALCSCSHAATLEKFRNACLRGIGRAGRAAQIIHTGEAGPDHPLHPQLAESGYLKAVIFRVLPA
ncbi:RSP_2647 family RNA methyltransferase [Mangrovicoccus algicola]|uniref:Class I SAM-dependent rRNA methyltransferase n=1 Tax=Mangrovicoccus algicola TaxID=2771008 RepID=A0A8J6YX92_9RHOB|nr:class I SAM-dependent rRNA methyltransferase [Mangrovicoccus algicola]MBE3638014.1 class I SAM-dependent rRNA methyltransferase [Mangrovicoccus algicola]